MCDLQAPADGHLLDIVDNRWREEELPFDQILVPADKLPDPEADGGDSHLTLSEQVNYIFYMLYIFNKNFNFQGTKMD